MMSDYEVLVLKEIRKGRNDVKEIAKSLGLPEEVVRAAYNRVKGRERELERRSKVVFTRESFRLLIDIIILYVAITVAIQVISWFR